MIASLSCKNRIPLRLQLTLFNSHWLAQAGMLAKTASALPEENNSQRKDQGAARSPQNCT